MSKLRLATLFLLPLCWANSDSIADTIPSLEVGPTVENVSDGIAGPAVTALSVKGRFIDYSAEKIVRFLSEDEMLYLGCDIVKVSGGVEGDCREWRVVNLRTAEKTVFDLPGFDHDWSYPTLRSPLIAYVAVKGSGEISCSVFDWVKKSIVADTVIPEATTFPTDAPGFKPPVFSEDAREVSCTAPSFNPDSTEKTRVINMTIKEERPRIKEYGLHRAIQISPRHTHTLALFRGVRRPILESWHLSLRNVACLNLLVLYAPVGSVVKI